jgi:hypothetical protein
MSNLKLKKQNDNNTLREESFFLPSKTIVVSKHLFFLSLFFSSLCAHFQPTIIDTTSIFNLAAAKTITLPLLRKANAALSAIYNWSAHENNRSKNINNKYEMLLIHIDEDPQGRIVQLSHIAEQLKTISPKLENGNPIVLLPIQIAETIFFCSFMLHLMVYFSPHVSADTKSLNTKTGIGTGGSFIAFLGYLSWLSYQTKKEQRRFLDLKHQLDALLTKQPTSHLFSSPKPIRRLDDAN